MRCNTGANSSLTANQSLENEMNQVQKRPPGSEAAFFIKQV